VHEPREIQELIQKGLKELQMMKVRIKERAIETRRIRLLFLFDKNDNDHGISHYLANHCLSKQQLIYSSIQRQTVVSQFYQLDRLVVEGGKTVCNALKYLRSLLRSGDSFKNGADTLLLGQANREKK